MTSVRVAVLGPSGRMGRALIDAAAGRTDVTLAAAIDRADSPGLGGPLAPGVVATADRGALGGCDVYIDFTAPAATRAFAVAASMPAVIGTTGLGVDDEAALADRARRAPIVVAANFSLGVNLVLGLVETAARVLGPDWDAEVVETHHKAKRDAPSGTALMIAHAIAAGHGADYEAVKRHARDGDIGPRPRGEIEIGHRASSRAIFASGALRAAAWVVGKPPGRYDMLDVLGFARR
ncbi:MAG: 4-hydroxy-tetrahydrodipicolinate reductase [Proteobacteria bacterium]|nr:4-hydroxy-tetrahydrodipicolinate reductase [Pseudomonadota bacterium]